MRGVELRSAQEQKILVAVVEGDVAVAVAVPCMPFD